jgi:hypothetical protein
MTETVHPLESNTYIVKDLPVLRHRLEVQSFLNQPCEILHELKHWWRFTPTLNWIITLVGTIMAWPQILFVQATLMGVAVITSSHPLDWLYNFGVRFLTGTAPLPKSGQRRKVVFAMAGVLIALLGGWFYLGYNIIGYIQGGIMTLLGGLLVIFNLCVISEVMAKIFGMPKR